LELSPSVKGCVDESLIKQIEEQSKEVCSFSDCKENLKILLNHLGYSVEVQGNRLLINDYRLIKEVRFIGLPKELLPVKKTVTLMAEGKLIDSVNLENIKQILRLKLHSFGYSEPNLSLTLKREHCGYVLLVKVEGGYRLVVKEISVVAPNPFKELALSLFSPLKGRAVNYVTLSEIEEKLEEELSKRGYYNGRVSISVILEKVSSFSLEKVKPVSLFIKVEPGKLYKVRFKGNNHFDSRKLESLTTFKRARSVDEFELENSKRRIEEFYRNNGFPFVRVSYSVFEKGSTAIITFTVEEGVKVIVKRVECKGFNLEEKRFKSLLGKPFNYEKVKEILSEIKALLKEKGYLSPSVSYEVDRGGNLRILVRKGPLYRVVSVSIFGDRLSCFKVPHLPLPLTYKLKKRITDSIYRCYSKKGYPDVKVDLEEELISSSPSYRDYKLILKVSPGQFYRFCYVLVRGLKRTKLYTVKNLIIIEPGEVYSREKVTKQYSKLLDSRLFSSIRISEVKGKGCFSQVIDLKEGALFRAKGFIGYGTDSGYVSNGLVSSTSPFGMGVKYFLFGNYRQKEGYDAVFKLLKPAFPFRDYDVSYSIVKKEQIYESFKFDRVYYDFSIHRKASRSFSQEFSFKISRSKLKDTSIRDKKLTLERKFSYTQLYDKRDNVSNPKKGFLSKTVISLSGLLLGGDTSYYLIEERFNYLYSFGRSVLSFRFGAGAITSLEGKKVPVEDRFFLGGAESVRGYKYGTISPVDEKGNFVGGRAYGLFSLELRYPLKGNLEGALFYDSGKVFPSPQDFRLSGWYSSVGVGLRYITPVGPLRVDYGYKLKKVSSQGRGRFHISFGFPF